MAFRGTPFSHKNTILHNQNWAPYLDFNYSQDGLFQVV